MLIFPGPFYVWYSRGLWFNIDNFYLSLLLLVLLVRPSFGNWQAPPASKDISQLFLAAIHHLTRAYSSSHHPPTYCCSPAPIKHFSISYLLYNEIIIIFNNRKFLAVLTVKLSSLLTLSS